MPLVDYPSSDEEDGDDANVPEDQPQPNNLKRKREAGVSNSLPPLPAKFHNLYASTVRSSTRDDPSLHGGRKRVTPHVEGNWPTHVYIEWYPSATDSHLLTTIINKVKKSIDDTGKTNDSHDIHSFLTSDLGTPLPLHISLSRPIGFLTEKKDDFVTSLDSVLKVAGVHPFSLHLTTLKWVPNFEKTRYFLVLHVQPPPFNELNKLLFVVNKVVQEHGQPPLYTTPRSPKLVQQKAPRQRRPSKSSKEQEDSYNGMEDRSDAFHFSIAWSLKAPSAEIEAFTQKVFEDCQKQIGKIEVKVNELKNKVGNVVHGIDLARKGSESSSLFGL